MEKLILAVQKSGRLLDDSLKLLKESGLRIETTQGQLKAVAANFPLEILFLRNGDIPQYLEDGVLDCTILGENTVIESGFETDNLVPLQFSRCRLSLAVPKSSSFTSIRDFEGKKIATSYTNSLQNYLDKNGVTAEIHNISGAVEIAPAMGLADGICDLVSSGNTLMVNGLKEIEILFQSQAYLVARKNLPEQKQELLNKLIFRIKSVLEGRNSKYILLNAPEESLEAITQILPGMKSPTVLPLATKGWLSVHSVIGEDVFWEKIDALKQAGAEGILVVPIEKMIF